VFVLSLLALLVYVRPNLYTLLYYNFHTYRSDVHKLFCRCISSSSSLHVHAPTAAVVAATDADAKVARRVRADTAV